MYEPARSGASQKRPPSSGGKTRRDTPTQRKRKKKNIAGRIVFWARAFAIRLLIFFLITLLLGAWWYRSQFYSDVGDDGKKITYTVDNGSGTSFTANASRAWSGGVVYTDITALYPQFNMAAVGSLDSMRFIIKLDGIRDSTGDGSEQYVIFTDGSRTANINGTSVVMQSCCRVIGEDIWIPLSFIENYTDGINVDHASENTVVFTSPDYLEAKAANKEAKKPKKLKASDYPIKPRLRLERSDTLKPIEYSEEP